MNEHRKINRNCSSREIIQAGGAYIELLENYYCNTLHELLNRERYHIINNSNCCNIIKYIIPIYKINEKIKEIDNMKERHYKNILSKYKLKEINDNSDTEDD